MLKNFLFVIPTKVGIQLDPCFRRDKLMDSGFRRNDILNIPSIEINGVTKWISFVKNSGIPLAMWKDRAERGLKK